ncbi:Mu transposase C-terminal domain-containing protein [Microvirga sesbaniae]|uniref:Mu transposase C-terminal domain-containing protein n=1 Tax=Microvirga sesbaniae TaxID=681392 RepID=UPI0021CA2A04|nr:Mu transposase C-terminal domain-containing protein [Microvirga sp. HBU67692]
MTATRLNWHKGEHVLIKDEEGIGVLWRVIERDGKAWRLVPVTGGDTKTFDDDNIRVLRCKRHLEHHPGNRYGLSPEHAELLRKAWDAHKPEHQLVADIKLAYCRRVDELRDTKLSFDDCYERACNEVYPENKARWEQEARDIELIREADHKKRRQVPEEIRAEKTRSPEIEKPRPSTLETWYTLWVKVDRDRRILIPLYSKRGDRTPRLKGGEINIYERMDFYIHNFYFDPDKKNKKQNSLRFAHRQLEKELKAHNLYVSYAGFRKYKVRKYTKFEEDVGLIGFRKAMLKHDVFRRIRSPDYALDEIEIDHCLIDLIVVDERSGRPIGRPWLTVALDRATRMILGVHLSFEVPSYASLQRCLAHAFWPKDLTGLDLKHDWPCEGIPKRVFTDNGREFLSRSLKRTEEALGFSVIQLPGRSPWLKGKVERFFGTMNAQVLNHEDGKTFSNTQKRKDYDSVGKARISLNELRSKLTKWIVDDYHVTSHEGLKGLPGSMNTPLEAWYQKTDPEGVRGVPDFEHIRRLTGATFLRPITKNGVRLFGLYYWHEDLTDLRRRGGNPRYEIRADPYNIGEVSLLDHVDKRWIDIPCDRPELAVGVTIHQSGVHIKAAKKAIGGRRIDEDDLLAMRRKAKEESEAILADENAGTTATRVGRYRVPNGQYFTPVAGETGIAASNDDEPPVTQDATELPEIRQEPPPEKVASPPDVATEDDMQALLAERLAYMKSRRTG